MEYSVWLNGSMTYQKVLTRPIEDAKKKKGGGGGGGRLDSINFQHVLSFIPIPKSFRTILKQTLEL